MRFLLRFPSATGDRRERIDLQSFFDRYQASGGGFPFFFHSPLTSANAVVESLRLPVLAIEASRSASGEMVHRGLASIEAEMRTPLHRVVGVVTIPEEIAGFTDGSSMQTLRRKTRAAVRRGVTWEAVTDHARRRSLIDQADAHERTAAAEPYRSAVADNSELIAHGLWLVARSADRVPVLLSVTPIDGTVGVLRYFRTLATGEDASVARYLMTQVLVEQLHRLGVRHLVDTAPTIRLSPGLRHFQRMVGFRLTRLRFLTSSSGPRAANTGLPAERARAMVRPETVEQYSATAGREELVAPT